MEAMQKIKQPAPELSSNASEITNTQEKKYKIIPAQNTGVIQAPKISSTPIRDMVEIKRNENPHIIYKIHTKKDTLKGIETTAGIGVILCGIASLVKLFKK